MRDERASFTAGYVAACRGLGRTLDPDACLVDDPYAARFLGPVARRLVDRLRERAPGGVASALTSLFPLVLYMQVRTRALDDVVARFAGAGGRQVVLLGAGFDARAARLPGLVFFEVDHPATQRRKRALLGDAATRETNYVPFHFERDPMSTLPAALAEHGHMASQPTLTIWEGVTMYLTEPAIEASLAAVRAYSRDAEGSLLAMTYFDRLRLDNPTPFRRFSRAIVAALGEPFRFGWDPPALPGWMSARSFRVDEDRDFADHARRLLPERFSRRVAPGLSRLALCSII